MLKEQDGCPWRPISLLGIDGAFQLSRDLGAERLRGQGHETHLGGTCQGHRNLMSKIIRQHQGLIGHRYPLMCDGYLQQKGRSVEHYLYHTSSPKGSPNFNVFDRVR